MFLLKYAFTQLTGTSYSKLDDGVHQDERVCTLHYSTLPQSSFLQFMSLKQAARSKNTEHWHSLSISHVTVQHNRHSLK